jgi:ATP-dependent Clp protease adaptor protein ClpS
MSTILEEETLVEERLAPRVRVIIHNDDVTPMDFVVDILRSEFELDSTAAEKIMWEAHGTGAAHVLTCGEEEATLRVDRSHSKARARNFPLTFSIEPEEL